MPPESTHQNPRRPWTLLLGPGAGLGQCLPLLEALAQSREEAPAALEQLGDWSQLFSCLDDVGQMLVDADQFGLEDLGLMRAFMKRFPRWDVALLGKDAAKQPLRELLRSPQVSWVPAPLDMDSMGWLLEPPSQLYGGRVFGQPNSSLRMSAGNGDPAGNIPVGYVTRSTEPYSGWGSTERAAKAQAASRSEAVRPKHADQPGTLNPPESSSGSSATGRSAGNATSTGQLLQEEATSGGVRKPLPTYEIPRADPALEPAGSPGGKQTARFAGHRDDGNPDIELNEETERQLLAEVERILVGGSRAESATAVAIAPPKTKPATSVPEAFDPQTEEPQDAELTEALAAHVNFPPDLETPADFAADLEDVQALEAEANAETVNEFEDTRLEPGSVPADLLEPDSGESELGPGAPEPAPFFKHQVADLADIVQCVDMGLDQAAEDVLNVEGVSGARLAARFEQLCGEVARLRQYTRTLAFMASPPSRGHQRFDLAPMLEEMLTMRRSEENAPRYLIRVQEPLPLCSDKLLLTQALDAFLFLCHACSGPQGTVRVDGRVLVNEASDVQVSIRFPAGLLAELEPDMIMQPYALRRSMPELGPNSLLAAAGILRGQGGEVELRKEPRGGLEWLIRLPRA